MNMQTKMPVTHTTSVLGTVKWYDPAKGFGFVIAPGLGVDALLHRHSLEGCGMTSITEGTQISFCYDETPNGVRVTHVTAVEVPSTSSDMQPDIDDTDVSGEAIPVRVKWFDQAKGYGFVNRFGCSQDVFIGRDALNRSALQMVETGQALCVMIAGQDAQQKVHTVKDWFAH